MFMRKRQMAKTSWCGQPPCFGWSTLPGGRGEETPQTWLLYPFSMLFVFPTEEKSSPASNTKVSIWTLVQTLIFTLICTLIQTTKGQDIWGKKSNFLYNAKKQRSEMTGLVLRLNVPLNVWLGKLLLYFSVSPSPGAVYFFSFEQGFALII